MMHGAKEISGKQITFNEFLEACANGDIEVVEEAITYISHDLIAFVSKLNPLCLAVKNGHTEVVERLLEIDAVKNNAAAMDNAALCCAAIYGHPDVVNMLLEIDAVNNNAAARDNEALCWAVSNGHLAVVKRLLEIEDVRNKADADYNTALRLAALNGYLAIVRCLLKVESVRKAHESKNGDLTGVAHDALCLESVEAIVKKLAENYPRLKASLERENQARAVYFAYKAAKRGGCPESPLRSLYPDLARLLCQTVKNSPPPAEGSSSKRQRL